MFNAYDDTSAYLQSVIIKVFVVIEIDTIPSAVGSGTCMIITAYCTECLGRYSCAIDVIRAVESAIEESGISVCSVWRDET